MAKTAAQRKQDQRERDKALGSVDVRLTLTDKMGERLDKICEAREFDRAELIQALIYQDSLLVDELTKDFGLCEFCSKPLPVGCGGQWKGAGACFKTVKQRELLSFDFMKNRFKGVL